MSAEALFQKLQQSIYIKKKIPTNLVDVLYYTEPILLGSQSYPVTYEWYKYWIWLLTFIVLYKVACQNPTTFMSEKELKSN